MGWLDAVLGRSKPVPPDLDALFALPSAAVTLEASTGLRPTGTGSVCVKPAEGPRFARAQEDAVALLRVDDAAQVQDERDAFGYLWSSCRASPEQLPGLVTGLHGANTAYASAGFGSGLLCSVVGFAGEVEGRARRLALVYLYKQGTFYPFAPTGPESRDTPFELQLRAVLDGDLRLEPELSRWFPVWGAPGL